MSGNCLPDNQKFRARFVYRGIHQDEVEVVRRRQRTATFRQRLVERKWKIEGLFGEAKQNHSLRRARYRGLSKVQIQFFMIAIALNCKRAVAISSLLRLIDLILRRLSRHQPYSSTTLSGQPDSESAIPFSTSSTTRIVHNAAVNQPDQSICLIGNQWVMRNKNNRHTGDVHFTNQLHYAICHFRIQVASRLIGE